MLLFSTSFHSRECRNFATFYLSGVSLSPGGGPYRPPSGFSCAIAKRHKIISSYLVTFPSFSLRTFQKNGRVRSGQGTRAGFLTPPQRLRKVCNHVRASLFHGATSSLQVFITIPVYAIYKSHNLYI